MILKIRYWRARRQLAQAIEDQKAHNRELSNETLKKEFLLYDIYQATNYFKRSRYYRYPHRSKTDRVMYELLREEVERRNVLLHP